MVHILAPISAFLLISLGHAWDNEFRRKLSFTCPGDEVLSSMASTFSATWKDRKWRHHCKYIGIRKDCQWSGDVNHGKQQFNFMCPPNKMLVGHSSYYISSSEDRRIQYLCCGIGGIQLGWIYEIYLTKLRSNFHWDVYSTNVILGFNSSYNVSKNYREFTGHYSGYSRIVCGNPGTPENSVKSSLRFVLSAEYFRSAEIKSITTFSYDDVVKYSCLEGYAQVGGSSSRTCLGNRTWSGSDIRCEKVNCGNPGPGVNSIKNGSVYTFGASLKYRCKAGYHVTGGSELITCEATKAWSDKPLRCSSAVKAAAVEQTNTSDWQRVIPILLGGFVGGIAAVLFVLLLIYIIRKRRCQTREQSRTSREEVAMHEQIRKPVQGKAASNAKASRTADAYENLGAVNGENAYEAVHA